MIVGIHKEICAILTCLNVKDIFNQTLTRAIKIKAYKNNICFKIPQKKICFKFFRFLSKVNFKSSLYFLCYVMENIVRKQDEGNKWFITQQEYSGIEITVISSDPGVALFLGKR